MLYSPRRPEPCFLSCVCAVLTSLSSALLPFLRSCCTHLIVLSFASFLVLVLLVFLVLFVLLLLLLLLFL